MIQPLGVVDEAQDRLLLPGGGEESEDRREHEKPIGPDGRRQPERASERGGLSCGHSIELAENWADQAIQARERKVRLALDPGSPKHGHRPGTLSGVPKECGLANSGA